MRLKLLLLLLVPITVFSQSNLTGTIRDAKSGEGIAGASILLGDLGVVSDQNGFFLFKDVKAGYHTLTVSFVGYQKYQQKINLDNSKNLEVDIMLTEDRIELDEVVVSATRSENRISEIPGRVNLISPERLTLTVAQTTDEYLALIPGVQVSRSFGLFSHKSSVTMRGLSGNEQARTLVLIDGIPVNKADGGSVNWNLVSTGDIERVEVVKGPGSALYGGNAMGGIINIVNRHPQKNLEGSVNLDIGTYFTRGIKAKMAGKLGDSQEKYFYWAASGIYHLSDGYITQPAPEKYSDYVVKSNFNEKALSLKTGFENGEKVMAEIDFTYYDDTRGTGEQYIQPEGNTTDHDTYQIRSTVKGEIGKLGWNASLFYLEEHYKRVSEWQKDDYTWYDVLSIRSDYGLMSSVNYSLGSSSLIAGFDIRNGAVDASDIYYTSTDKVDNRGKMNFYGIYLQDQISAMRGKMKILAGVRYDFARFYEGAFIINSPSAETVFLDKYQFSNLNDEQWGAFSPRLSVQYKPNEAFRIYSSYSRGFRPSVLDDLCRTGRVKGGMKVANPILKPEYLDNFELGGDYKMVDWLKLSASVYYSLGRDFLYYVSTGETIDMGFGERPIMIRSNISNVRIYGVEFEFSATPLRYLNLFGSYAFTTPKITGYEPLATNDPTNLEGKYLTDVPRHSFSVGALFQSDILNMGLTCKYIGKMFINDQNIYDDIVLSDQYPAAFTVDIRLAKEFAKHYSVSLSIQNVFDEKIYDSKNLVGPGRFITLGVGMKL